MRGAVALNSRRAPATPVMFRPGRARLATSPRETGSSMPAITMGTVCVALFAASASVVPGATIRSTGRRTSSAATLARRSVFPSPRRYSTLKVLPLIQPRPVIARSKTPRFSAEEPKSSQPIRRVPSLCARAAAGSHKAASAGPRNSRRFIALRAAPYRRRADRPPRRSPRASRSLRRSDGDRKWMPWMPSASAAAAFSLLSSMNTASSGAIR